ncbi:MAG: SufD family Fe-S cluster assembly protein [Syntrophomonadaceae bacterium]|nr:SufD family Fe-S cluster assembly protein [Syntrophomonadaceae bacterium]
MKYSPLDSKLLETIADLHGIPQGAFNIRKDGEGFRQSSANIEIIPKKDKPGIDIVVKPGTKDESVHIPVILTKSGLKDLVYNTFIIGEDADVTIIAGCGIHNSGEDVSEHDGIHEFFVKSGARLKYIERHYGQGDGTGRRVLNPTTIVTVENGAYVEMEMVQIKGVDNTVRNTDAFIHDRGALKIIERLLTHGEQEAVSNVTLNLLGLDASGQVLSRTVAQDNSNQLFKAALVGKNRCSGHVECDSIIMGAAQIRAIPGLTAESAEAVLTHEAAIGRIAGDQLIKLMTLGLDEQEAIDTILAAFLR